MAARHLREGHENHGHSYTSEYGIWRNLKQRCLNPNNPRFADYGGRGIKVAERWLHSFETFLSDVGYRPSPAHSLDRIDNNGNYEPNNCRWATAAEQQVTARRSQTLLTARGVTRTIREWAKDLGVDRRTIQGRLKTGWTVERAVTEPKRVRL